MPKILSQRLLTTCCTADSLITTHQKQSNDFINALELLYITFIYGRKKKGSGNHLLKLSFVTVKELSMIRGTCKTAKTTLKLSPLWLYKLKHAIINPQDLPVSFSFYLLSSTLFSNMNNEKFMRQILPGFNEAALLTDAEKSKNNTIIWTELIVHPTAKETKSYWLKQLQDMVLARASPSLTDVKKIVLVVLSLFHPTLKTDNEEKKSGEDSSDDVITSQYLVDMLSELDGKLNKVISSFLIAFFLYPSRTWGGIFQKEALLNNSNNKEANTYQEELAIMESCSNIQHPGKLLQDVESIRKTIGFSYLVSVEEIVTTNKWKIQPLSFSTRKKKLMLESIANLNALQLYDIFKHPQLWKQIFKSFGLRSLLLKKISAMYAKTSIVDDNNNNKYSTLLLFYYFLMQEKYPTCKEKFEERKWKERVVKPLKNLCDSGFFQMLNVDYNNDDNNDNKTGSPWLASTYQPLLSKKKLPKPSRMTVTNILSKRGNTKQSWLLLINTSSCTLSQVFMNIRNLMLINFPIDKLREYCMKLLNKVFLKKDNDVNAKSNGSMEFLITLMKLKHLFKNEFNDNFVARIVESIHKVTAEANEEDNTVVDTNNNDDNNNNNKKVEDETLNKTQYTLSNDECFIIMPEKLYTDKKGNLYGVAKKKVVSKQFDSNSVKEYLEFINELLQNEALKIQSVGSNGSDDIDVFPVISLTPELHDNCIRTGQPPVEPSYSTTSMWRNECLCIQQLLQHDTNIAGRENINDKSNTMTKEDDRNNNNNNDNNNNNNNEEKNNLLDSLAKKSDSSPKVKGENDNDLELVIGITWCEKKNGPRVDLDLSAIMYTANWDELYNCSYHNLKRPGAQHSGDITSAPYPKGARESIHFKFNEMAVDKVKYVAFTVHNFTGQPIDNVCSDASIFVAHGNKTGTGPGGLDIIVASALKSEGTNSISGVLIIGRDTKFDVDNDAFISSYKENYEVRLISIDAAPKKIKSQQATQTSNLTRDMVKRNIDSGNYIGKPSKLPLITIAALNAGVCGNKVLIEHGEIQRIDETIATTNTILEKETDESIIDYIERIVTTLNALPVTISPNYSNLFDSLISKMNDKHIKEQQMVLIIGTQNDINMSRDICNTFTIKTQGGKNDWLLGVANLRTHKASSEVQTFAGVSSNILTIENVDIRKSVNDYIGDITSTDEEGLRESAVDLQVKDEE